MTTGKLISIGRHEIAEDGFSHEPTGDNSMMRSYTFVDGAFVKMTVDAMHECDVLSSREVRIVSADAFDMTAHLNRQIDWASETFGPGPRTAALLDHIRKELAEIAADPSDAREWLDVVILALEGAMRTGVSPTNLCVLLTAMQERNEARKWADWRTAPPGVASEHDRTAECRNSKAPPGYRELVLCGSEGGGYVTAPNGDIVAVDGDWSAAWTHYDTHGRTAPSGAAIEHERTTTAEDRSKPPLGYRLIHGCDGFSFADHEGGHHAAAMHNLGHGWRQDAALANAWAHHDARAEAFSRHLDNANAVVATWPAWKQRVLGGLADCPTAEDRSKPPPGYRLALECYGFVVYDPEGIRYGGCGWRHGEALVEAWLDYDACAHGSTPR